MEAVATTHMEIPDFRDTFIQKAIDAKDYDKARSLLQDGIRLAEQQKNAGTISRWRKRLLEIAYLHIDIPNYRTNWNICTNHTQYSLEHYRKLKATIQRKNGQVHSNGCMGWFRSATPPADVLLQEENNIPALYELIKRPIPGQGIPFQTLCLAAEAFPHWSEATMPARFVITCVSQHLEGRSQERVIDELNVLAKMPDGANMAHNLVKDFCNRYNHAKHSGDVDSKRLGRVTLKISTLFM